ncbi:MAG: hypothetical protein R3C12_10615 [Planctomycetaceae bacterium]|nr:hypothetical protein [Planctomycetaceae bacterium]
MELRACPACQQSVLDDDAVTCPFCGAAMDGSSGPTKPLDKPAEKPASKPAGKAEAKPAAPVAARTKSADPENPFDVAPRQARKVIALRPKPTAKTMHRVVCPMCDTAGFGTPAIAGKEVKCANPKCLMPIFTAPEIEKEAPPPPKKSLFTPLNLAIFGLILVAAGGGIFYAMVLQKPAPAPEEQPVTLQPRVEEHTVATEETTTPKAGPPLMPISELQAKILASSVDSARQRDDNRSKEFCRILAANAFINGGNISAALEQLQAFDNLNSGLDFMKIAPLCRIGWHHLQQGDRAAAEKVAEQALEYAAKLPQTGADAVQQAVVLGTLLVALEKYEQARVLIETRESTQEVAQSAARMSMIIEDETYNLAESYRWLPRVELASPLAFAATYGATVHGHAAQARAWLDKLQVPERKAICLAGYAAGLAMRANRAKESFAVENLLTVAGVSQYDTQRAVGIALQVLHQEPKNQALVKSLTQQLNAETSKWETPAASTIPEFKGVYEGTYQLPASELQTALQTLLLEARSLSLAGQPDAAWGRIETALAWTPALGPAQTQTEALASRLDQERVQIENRLATMYEITRDDLKRAAFNQYRKNARTIEEQAQKRLDQETRILELALDWGLAPQLHAAFLKLLQADATGNTQNVTRIVHAKLIPDLLFALNEAGLVAEARDLGQKAPETGAAKSKAQLRQQVERLMLAGQSQQAHELFRSVESQLREPLLFVRWSCLLAENNSPATVIDWINAIPDPVEKELSLRMTAAQFTQRGQIREYWKTSELKNLSATQKNSRNLGLMEGLATTDAYQEEVTPATSPPLEAAAR